MQDKQTSLPGPTNLFFLILLQVQLFYFLSYMTPTTISLLQFLLLKKYLLHIAYIDKQYFYFHYHIINQLILLLWANHLYFHLLYYIIYQIFYYLYRNIFLTI